MTTQEQIDFFFAPPLPMQTGASLSPLHLLRREAQDCLIGDVIPEHDVISDPRRHRLFATTMVMMAGIDLLAKFYAGSDQSGQVGKRFEAFARDFIVNGDRDLAKALYEGCRNPLLHSFTLHSATARVAIAREVDSSHGAVWRLDATTFVVSVEGLYRAFVGAVNAYQTELAGRADLQANFVAMFPSYGTITQGQIVPVPGV